MIAKIKTNDGYVYDTVVFAWYCDGWKSKIIGFDKSGKTLEYIDYFRSVFHIEQQMIITDWDMSGYIETENRVGYDFIINDKTLCKMIKQGKKLPGEVFERCKKIQDSVKIKEWYEITDEKSVSNILSAAGGFHDGEIKSIVQNEEKTQLVISVWGGEIHFIIENAEFSENLKAEFGCGGEIYGANIFFEQERIFWVNSSEVNCTAEIDSEDEWFSASKICWKAVL